MSGVSICGYALIFRAAIDQSSALFYHSTI
jgi:hypothetical protein